MDRWRSSQHCAVFYSLSSRREFGLATSSNLRQNRMKPDDELSKVFGSELRRFMEFSGLLAKELAAHLKVSRQALYKYLWGQSLPCASGASSSRTFRNDPSL